MLNVNRNMNIKSYDNPPPWHNRHENVIVENFKRFYDIETPDPRDGTQIIGDLRLTVEALKGIIADAAKAGQRLRCIGGSWSLSNVVETDGWLINTRGLNLCLTSISNSYVSENYNVKKDPASLYFAQCGTSVQELIDILFKDRMTLTTVGASNGQTIVGAIATGTHGSAYNYGSMTEYVVGIHLIVSPERDIWLERKSYPVVSEEFIELMGTELVADDDLFNAVLVSFGSFGIVHGVMIEAEPVYLLEATRKRYPFDDKLREAMRTLDFSKIPVDPKNLWHFEIDFNPYDIAGGAYVTTMYRRPCPLTYQEQPVPSGQYAIGNGFLSFIGKLSEELSSGSVGWLVNKIFEMQYKDFTAKLGTPGETFSTTDLMGKAMSMELGVSLENAEKVLDLLVNAKPEVEVYPGVFSFRYVKRSSAMLGFTKFDNTCTIEFNASYNARTVDFYNRVWNDLAKSGIPYTLHWGQMGNYSPALALAMYGADVVKTWKDARTTLLDASMQKIFSSPFTDQCGLS